MDTANDTDSSNVPVLRFPGFKEEWGYSRMGDVCSIATGKLNANAMVTGGLYRFYTCAREFYQIDEYAFDTDALLISGNGANVGYIHHYKGKFNAYQRTYVLDKFSLNKIFLYHFLEKNLVERIAKEKKAGNTPYIVLDTLTDLRIYVPTLPEQQKIADFLTAIDKHIELLEKKVELLKQRKTWLLTNLLTVNPETNAPSLRYPGFEGEWPSIPLGRTWTEFSIRHDAKEPGSALVASVGGRGVYPRSETYGHSLTADYSTYKSAEGNDLIFGMGSVHIAYGVVNEKLGKVIVSPAYKTMCITDVVTPTFLSLLLKNYSNVLSYRYMIISARNGKAINWEDLAKHQVHLPTIQEQQKIASSLTTVDNHLELLDKKLELLKHRKTWLLKNLLEIKPD